ncbi:MAG TPA: ACT domain-containing protein, partial [Acidimicrobiia bacterium]|nr:ACT domain-containing protein [Acidimicrobiia bacterium]
GNIDTRVLSSVLLRALARSGRVIRLQIEVPDRPGVLAMVADIVGSCRGNIVDVAHHRDQPGVAVKRAMLELSIETRDRSHADEIVNALTSAALRVTRA